MPEIELELGAVVDVAASKDVHDVGRRLDDLTGLFQRDRLAHRPLRRTVAAGATSNGTSAVINLGGPSVGRLWNVVTLAVTGTDDRTVVAGATVATYVGDPDNVALAGLLIPANGTAVPYSTTWNKDQVWVHDDERVFVVVYGAANNQQLIATARVLDWPQDTLEARVI